MVRLMTDSNLPEIDLLLIGHIAADVIPGGFQLGGTVSYAAATASPFGLRIGVITSARADEPLLDELRRYAYVINIPSEKTTSFKNVYTDKGRVQYWPAKGGDIHPEHVPEAWRKTPLVHIGVLSDEISEDVLDVFDESSHMMVTPQGWMRDRAPDDRVIFRRWFSQEVLRRVAMVVISEEDIAAAPDLRDEYAAATGLLIVTDGEKGGTYYVDGELRSYEAVPLSIGDLTGAGDVFAITAFLAWDRLNHHPDAAVQVAAYLAACSISRVGMEESAPTQAEIEAAFARVTQND